MSKDRPKLLITAHIERFSDCYEEMKSLNLLHYDEISEHKKHGIPLNPDYSRYLAREQAGELLYVTLRNCGQIVGYYIGFIMPDLHYKDCLRLFQDIIYIHVQCRGQNAFPLLMDVVEAEGARRGARLITGGVKDAHKLHMTKLLLDRGYKPFEIHYVKWIT